MTGEGTFRQNYEMTCKTDCKKFKAEFYNNIMDTLEAELIDQ